jgi:hypothetical protein
MNIYHNKIKYCTGCGSILNDNNTCSNVKCVLLRQELENEIDKYFYQEFGGK